MPASTCGNRSHYTDNLVSFFRRMFSADYRAAVAAEAAGNVDLAAERYALAGEHAGAVRMHLARAARAADAARRDRRAARCDALGRRRSGAARDRPPRRSAARCGRPRRPRASRPSAIARRCARPPSCSSSATITRPRARRSRRSAITSRRRTRTRRAASSSRWRRALAKDDAVAAARARGGRRVRELRDRTCGSAGATTRAPSSRARSRTPRAAGEYRRLLDQLDTALLTAGKVELKRRGKPLIVACAAPKIVLGRDPLCDLTLRAGGVSRQHAEIDRSRRRLPAARPRLAQRHVARRAAARRQGPARRRRPASGSATSARSTSRSPAASWSCGSRAGSIAASR